MADKRFGVRELIVLGSGTPTITSPGDLNINSDTLGISTNITIGGKIGLVGTGVSYGGLNQVLTSNGPNADPTWKTVSGSSGTATNLAGGAAGSLPYQSAADTTAFLAEPNADNKVLSYNNTSDAPIWIDASTIPGIAATDRIFEGNTSAEVVDTGTDGHFKVLTEGTERLRITSNGFVGIGSIQPTVELDVNGKVALGSSVYDSNGSTGTGGQVLSSIPGIGVSWTDQTGGSGGGSSDPVGTIVAWAGSAATIPSEYQLCDGSAASTSALQAITGSNVPDLRDRFIVGAGSGYTVNATGGAATHTLTVGEMPSHNHPFSQNSDGTYDYYWIGQADVPKDFNFSAGSTPPYELSTTSAVASQGGGQAHNNLPPYYALCYIIKHTATSGGGSGGGTTKIAVLSEEQSSGTDGGGFTNNAWRDRTLNTEVDQQSFVTFSSSNNYFTLDSGTYKINWSAPAHAVDRHQSKLLYADNASFTSSSEKLGSSEACYDPITEGNSLVQTRSFGETVITITETTYFKIQHRCTDTKSTTGFGVASNFGVDEVYTQVVIQDLNSGGGSGGGGGTGTLTDVDVKQYSDSNTPRTEYGCSNPIEVTVTAGIATIGIGSTSNAYGKKYIQTTEPTTDVCDGDIWYDITPGSGSSGGFVTGMIMMFSGTTAPTGWVLCNGSNGTPDLRDRFIVGATIGGDTTYPGVGVGSTGGSADAVVVSHTHTSPVGTAAGGGPASLQGNLAAGNINTGSASGGVPGTNKNLPPYYALAFIMKT